MLEAMKSLRDEMHSMKKASESDVVQTFDSLPKAGPSKQPDPIPTRTCIPTSRASDHLDAQPMNIMELHFLLSLLEVSSPNMFPGTRMLNPTTRIIIPSRNNQKRCIKKPKNILTKGSMVRAKYYSQSSSSEEDESSATITKPTKPQHKAPDEPEHQDSTDPVFYREVDMSDLPSQYAEEVETFRQILDLPGPRETLSRSSTTVLGLDDEKGQQELRPRGPSAMLPLNPILKDAFEKFEQDLLASNLP